MNKPKLKPPVRACVRNPDSFSKAVACEVRELMAYLGAAGWSLWDIAEAVGCSRTALVSWRNDAADMPMKRMLKLRAVVAEHGRKATGT